MFLGARVQYPRAPRNEVTLPQKKSTPKARQAASPAHRLDGIQVAGLAIILLMLTLTWWWLRSSSKPLKVAQQWASPPAMAIDTSKQYLATVVMANSKQFVIQLAADKAPITVNSFVFLANHGFFDGTTFHRVLDGFMAQGGDPSGTGGGGPGYQFANEVSDLKFDKAGVVAMANAGRDTNGSQFFITFGPQPQLDGDYTIFGQVISGMEAVNGLTRRNPDLQPSFTGDVMQSVTISTR